MIYDLQYLFSEPTYFEMPKSMLIDSIIVTILYKKFPAVRKVMKPLVYSKYSSYFPEQFGYVC